MDEYKNPSEFIKRGKGYDGRLSKQLIANAKFDFSKLDQKRTSEIDFGAI